MTSAPRFATFGMKTFSTHSWSSTSEYACVPSTSQWNRSGYWVGEWLPQIDIFLIAVTGRSTLDASWLIARL